MIAVVCIDDQYGMRFNGRRQSRDRILIEDLMQMVGTDKKLWIAPCSASLFKNYEDRLCADEDFLTKAEDGVYCFVEDRGIEAYRENLEGIVLYRWNRDYPADLRLDLRPDLEGWNLCAVTEFAGSSHEKITKEEYSKK